jgi:acetyltransferase-like isoleucine patch superfamily enzyme
MAARSARAKTVVGRFIRINGWEYAGILKEQGRFAHIGEGCMILSSVYCSIPELTWIGNNVQMASCSLINHGGEINVVNKATGRYLDCVGPITIEDDVFIGHMATILRDVRIGRFSIVAAGAVVARDVPPNSVVGGIPAKRIMSTEEFVKKMEERNEAFPWKGLIEERAGAYDASMEPELNRLRSAYFKKIGRLGPATEDAERRCS